MAYDRIISWVEDHFNAADYSSYFEFEQAVRNRFNEDGIDLPKGAESQMMDYFQNSFQAEDNTILQQSTFDSYIPPSPEILEISADFFNAGAPLTESVQPLPEIFQDAPQIKQQPITFFGKVGGFFRRLFRI
jgi:hypothetical protein